MKHIRRRQNRRNKALLECYILIGNCLKQEHVRDKSYICQQLYIIDGYRSVLPPQDFLVIEGFIEDEITPLLMDIDYFEFLKQANTGCVQDERGHFILTSNSSLEDYIFQEYHHTLDLQKQLKTYFITHFKMKGID